MTDIRIPFTRSPGRVCLVPPGDTITGCVTLSDIEQLKQLFGGVNIAIEDLQAQHRLSIHELQQVAIELAVAAASWLTQAAIDRDQYNLQQLIADSIEQLGSESPMTVRLNAQDYELLMQLQQEEGAWLKAPTNVQFVSDAGLARGSCTAEAQKISLVSDLETRLASVRQAWLENLDDAQTERRATGRDGWEPGRVPDRRETA